MYISVMFKNKKLEFNGKAYDFELAPNVSPPKTGDIIRMLSEDGKKVVCNGTRVKVTAVKSTSTTAAENRISFVNSSLNEPSLSSK